MVDPVNFTNFNRNKYELEEVLLYSIAVAGKTSHITSVYLEKYLKKHQNENETPFETIKRLKDSNQLENSIKYSSLGKHKILFKAFSQLADKKIDLKTCTLEELESIHGIGPKTSRMFLLHTRKNQDYAVLDVHILAYLNESGVKTPKSTPTNKRYRELERTFLDIVKQSGYSAADFDLKVWNERARKTSNI